jgi:hypothetical protein
MSVHKRNAQIPLTVNVVLLLTVSKKPNAYLTLEVQVSVLLSVLKRFKLSAAGFVSKRGCFRPCSFEGQTLGVTTQ